MMRTVNIPIEKLQEWLGEEAGIHDLWMTCDPISPELVVVVKSLEEPAKRRHRRRDLETDQLALEAALDRTMMNHA